MDCCVSERMNEMGSLESFCTGLRILPGPTVKQRLFRAYDRSNSSEVCQSARSASSNASLALYIGILLAVALPGACPLVSSSCDYDFFRVDAMNGMLFSRTVVQVTTAPP